MTITDIENFLFQGQILNLTAEEQKNIQNSYNFLNDFAKDKVIYGINTGFGPMAQYRISDEELNALQYNIIRSHSTGAGEPFEPIYVRAAMMARFSTFVRGKSGIHPDVMEMLRTFINKEIYPVIPQHGSVGASGDLVQLAHMSLALIGEGEVFYQGQRRPTAEVLKELGIKPLKLHLRDGLALVNGTAMMTGVGLVNLHYAKRLLVFATLASVLINEIAASYDDFMAPELNQLKGHNGQEVIARKMREIATGGQCMLKREVEMYHRHQETVFTHKVQPYYSLRCVPQILGPVLDSLKYTEEILVDEFHAVDDNPIVDIDTQSVYHGGNFHGDYVSFEMDKLKLAIVKLTVLVERQLNYLCHDRINGILPPFCNLGVLGLNYGIQALQFTATSTTAESQSLANSMYVHSIPNNNDNQDVVSMGTNSAILARRVIDNAYQVMAIYMIGLAQAVDCLKIEDKLAPKTKALYQDIRQLVPVFVEDTPKYIDISNVINYLKNKKIESIL
ncbi:MAG: aromatic amino acid lyase [Bacteroidales bacterium]|jgi:histidine ammonia-lyase|nr:aromatic amino acid lyase [Bacteroidales bacterium]